jgi:hypothetical protein
VLLEMIKLFRNGTADFAPLVDFELLHNRKEARCWWLSWLRHCATSLKVAGFFPDDVTGIFH